MTCPVQFQVNISAMYAASVHIVRYLIIIFGTRSLKYDPNIDRSSGCMDFQKGICETVNKISLGQIAVRGFCGRCFSKFYSWIVQCMFCEIILTVHTVNISRNYLWLVLNIGFFFFTFNKLWLDIDTNDSRFCFGCLSDRKSVV